MLLPEALKLLSVARKLDVSVSLELPPPSELALKCPELPPPEIKPDMLVTTLELPVVVVTSVPVAQVLLPIVVTWPIADDWTTVLPPVQ